MNLDADQFMKDMESVMRRPVTEDMSSDVDIVERSSSDMDFGNCFPSLLPKLSAAYLKFLNY